MSWTPADIPDLTGRRALVTGATDGLGLETVRALAAKGAKVIAVGRNPAKVETALARIRTEQPGADVTFEQADQSSLAAVRSLAERVGGPPLDILVNNAGVMGVPRAATPDGFESQFAVNYLSHFLLTGLLLQALKAAKAPRVVSLSSLAHRAGRIDFDDLQGAHGYKPFKAYGQSKLAMLMFALEVQRRSDLHGWGLISAAAHPGFSRTNLMHAEGASKLAAWFGDRIAPLFSHDAAAGAAPQILAATRPELPKASYWGPAGLAETKGPPAPARMSKAAADPAAAARLWDVSQTLTGHPFGVGA